VYTATDPGGTTEGDYVLVKAAGASLTVSDVATGVRWQDRAGAAPASGDWYTSTNGAALEVLVTSVADTLEPLTFDGFGYVLAHVQSTATNAITAASLASDAGAEIAAAVLAAGDADGFTLEQVLKLCLAALAGKLSGAGTTTVTIRAADDSKDRITATVDGDGNRTAVTLDAAG
jgi:uncharacterized protein YodC (DUF2158 family)